MIIVLLENTKKKTIYKKKLKEENNIYILYNVITYSTHTILDIK